MTPNPTPTTPDLRLLAPEFAGRVTLIAAGVVALVARAFLRQPSLCRFIVPLFSRLNRAARRLTGLMARFTKHGVYRPRLKKSPPNDPNPNDPNPNPNDPNPNEPTTRRQRVRAPKIYIPTTHAWLIRTLRHEAAVYACRLTHLLAEPGVIDLLDANPTARRLLRPLCRMLGLPATALGALSPQPTRAKPPQAMPLTAKSPPTEPAPVTSAPPQPELTRAAILARPIFPDLPWCGLHPPGPKKSA